MQRAPREVRRDGDVCTMTDFSLAKRGNRPDYAFGCTEGWEAFAVVRWHAVEEISRPYEYEIILRRDAALGPANLDELEGSSVTFRIASLNRWRPIHGIVAEAEEIDRTPTLFLYRVLLVPPFSRCQWRRRCRTYRGKSVAEVITALLENALPERGGVDGMVRVNRASLTHSPDPDFSNFAEPGAFYCIDVAEPRFADSEYRHHLVQYNESDFVMVSRLLEEEGVSYYFEHADEGVVMVITDDVGAFSPIASERKYPLANIGSSQNQEVIQSLRESRRMRSRSVKMVDFYEVEPLKRLSAERSVDARSPMTSQHMEFFGHEREVDDACEQPAQVRLERFECERSLTSGRATVRTLEPSWRFTMQDSTTLRADADYIVVRVEVFASELAAPGTALDQEPFGFNGAIGQTSSASYENRFEVLPASMPFRPARRTQKSRIHGVQSARVTAEEFGTEPPEINCDYDSSVKIRFAWDERPLEIGVSSSPWIYVSQLWAGPGFGAMFTPRVGDEVLVSFLEGDPEWPVIVGRVHSDQQPAPYDVAERPTVSTIKSRSSPKSAGYNELRFDDAAGAEEVYLRAERDLVFEVLHDARTTIAGNRQVEIRGGENSTNVGDASKTWQGNLTETVVGQYTMDMGNGAIYSRASFTAYATDNLLFSAGADRFDVTGANHYLGANSLFVNTKDVTQIVTPAFHVYARDEVVLMAGGSLIKLTPGGIEISTPGTIEIKGALVKVNC